MNGLRAWPTIALLLRRFTLRHWRTAPRSTALQILILALGIAVFFSIRLANRAAVGSFKNFTGLLSQSSDWQINAFAGELPASVLGELRTALGDEPVEIIPVLETTAVLARGDKPDEHIGSRATYHLLGLDLVAVQNLASAGDNDRSWFNQQSAATNYSGGNRFWQLLRQTNAVFISPALAKTSHLNPGDHLRVVIDENVVDLKIAGLIPTSPARPLPPENLLVLDLPALQQLGHRAGKLDRVEFVVPDGPHADVRRTELREKIAALGKNRWQVFSPADRRASAATMTRAFRMNLTILSLIGLLVGLYLIFQSLDGAVVRRREEIGVLRSLGITEKIIRRVWLLEAALLGLISGALGALMGWGGAQFAVRFVGRTVNAIYYATTVQYAQLDAVEIIIALTLAVAASLVAGWWPARQAAKIPPAQILSRHAESQERRSVLQSACFAFVLLAVGGALIFLPPLRFSGALRFPLGGYAAALLLILGGGILCSHLLRRFATALHFTGQYSLAAKIATSHLMQTSSRHRLAVAGLLCAVTMAAGMLILVASFETTMRGWVNNTFQADLYLRSDGAQSPSTQNRISPATWHLIATNPMVADVNIMQAVAIEINGVSTVFMGVDMGFSHRHPNLTWYQPPLDDKIWDADQDEHLALISESFSDRFRVRRGDSITIPTPAGDKQLTIAGVFSDYGNERGALLVERRHYAAWYGDELATGLILFMRPEISPDTLQAELTAQFPGLSIMSNRYLRSEILRVFRQTFSVTYALELIGIIVAVIGLGMTLSSILLDRRGELTTLRALGWRRREMARATAVEGALLSICGVAGGIVVSLSLGWILIYIINKQSFGWTLQFAIPWLSLASLGLLVIATGTVVAYFIGRWGSGLPADREE
ncbi:MAG TPA: FtsX-like permease family protein [Candidatus Acidoferrales bacterium]|jgi:putative ABC transport system permease protein|nr:FtsX-like permease family protein [Candidatus Acidoferrales bacterium]